jgi:hypothetical protein
MTNVPLKAHELAAWLVEERLAVMDSGTLWPTWRGLQLGDGLVRLG